MGETTAQRKRGRRPEDADARRTRVQSALADLESANVPFSMSDVAERAGISRATLYRDATLRDLIGGRGEGPGARPVNHYDYEKLRKELVAVRKERRELRRDLKLAVERATRLEAQNDALHAENLDLQRMQKAAGQKVGGVDAEKVRTDAYTEGFAAGMRSAAMRGVRGAGTPGEAGLTTAASRLPKESLVSARRSLARVLHPDLFVKEPATALLATELLKQLNALAGGNS